MKHIVLELSVVASLLLAVTACDKKSSASAAPNTTQPAVKAHVVDVQVGSAGFEPSSIALTKGENATLRFTRTTDQTCAKKVVFPELELEKDLPLNQAVEIPIPTDSARQVGFQCGMGMYKASVVIN